MKKGSLGYIKKKKVFQLGLTFILLLIGIAIYVSGYYLNNEQKNNVFTIIAILMVLPAAKAFTSFIVVAPFKTVSIEKFTEVNSDVKKDSILLADLVLTSTEKVMNLDFLVLMESNVIGVVGKQKQDVNYIETYLTKAFNYQDFNCHVKIFNDYKSFKNRISTMEHKSTDNTMIEKMKSHILTYAI